MNQENKFAVILDKAKISYLRQFSISPFFVDFFLPDFNLCIEIDGFQHRFDAKRSQYQYDQRRDAFIRSEGYRMIRLSNHQVARMKEDFFAKKFLPSLRLGRMVDMKRYRSTARRRVGCCIKGFNRRG